MHVCTYGNMYVCIYVYTYIQYIRTFIHNIDVHMSLHAGVVKDKENNYYMEASEPWDLYS